MDRALQSREGKNTPDGVSSMHIPEVPEVPEVAENGEHPGISP